MLWELTVPFVTVDGRSLTARLPLCTCTAHGYAVLRTERPTQYKTFPILL